MGTFIKGTPRSQSLTFNAVSGGIYGPKQQQFLGQQLIVTVTDFTDMGSPVTGRAQILLTSTIGGPPDLIDSNLTGTATFIR